MPVIPRVVCTVIITLARSNIVKSGIRKIIERNVKKKVAQLKASGISGMSIANLLQVTPAPPSSTPFESDNPVEEYAEIFKDVARRLFHTTSVKACNAVQQKIDFYLLPENKGK